MRRISKISALIIACSFAAMPVVPAVAQQLPPPEARVQVKLMRVTTRTKLQEAQERREARRERAGLAGASSAGDGLGAGVVRSRPGQDVVAGCGNLTILPQNSGFTRHSDQIVVTGDIIQNCRGDR